MKAKEFIPASKPRNFVAKNAQTSGAGRHQDSSKKKDQEQGKVKHKKDLVPMEGWSDAYVSRRTGRPRTPYSVYIKGKKWKDFENDDHARAVMDKLKAKFKADGRDPETITIAPTDYDKGMKEGESALEKFRRGAAEREKKHDAAEKEMKARHARGEEDMKGSIDRLEKHLKGDVKESFTSIPFDQCPSCGGGIVHESQLLEKQDACYHKVRSRYKVWPSAYASGALVQCRKKGAKNWGNKSKK